MIKWKEEYNIGIQLIDEQHKRLFEIADRAYELLKNDLVNDKYDRIVEILEELKSYTIFHFKSEEEYMLSIGYKRLLSQKVEHADFVEKIKSVDYEKIDQDQNKYILGILDFVMDWITHHILEKDRMISSQW